MKKCRRCGERIPNGVTSSDGAVICVNMKCLSVLEEDVVDEADTEFTCPICGSEVLYIGAIPSVLECPTRGCPNFRKY